MTTHSRETIRVLYIDDNAHDRLLVRDALETGEYPFALIETGTETEFRAQLAKGRFDLVLSDFNILGFDGLEVLDAVREVSPEVPVVIVTGTGSEETAVQALRRGVDDYVIKTPDHIRHLPHALAATLERVRQRAIQRQTEELLRSTEEIAHVGSWRLDLIDNTLTWSDETYRIFGLEPREFEATREAFSDAVHPEDRADVSLAYSRSVEQGLDGCEIEHRIIRKNSREVRFVHEKWNHERDTNNRIIGSVGMVHDITERKLAAQQQLAMEAQLRQSQKLESIGILAGGVAHEINNPVNGIMNYAQLIKDKLAESDAVLSGFAAEIISETERVAVIVKNLLAFARHEKRSHSPARLCDIVESTLSLVRTIMRGDQINLEVDIPEELPRIKCRSQQIQQVIMNLLTNARDSLNEKYSGFDEDKKISITARFLEKEGRGWIRTTVEDRGTGVGEEVMARMFDPFYTTKPRDKGTGLGLSISHGIVADHGGELSVESELGKWTRFNLDLPVNNGWHLNDEKTS